MEQPLPNELLGQTISDRYRIISQLGAGGMGVAYRAWDETASIPVVLKIPKKTLLADNDFAERFAREIRILTRLEHPHIVPVVDSGTHEQIPFYVMRFLPGGSLSDRRLRDDEGKPRANPPGMLHLWLPAVAGALDSIHQNNVIHRDVKPANIFFDAFWGAFLGDFGIAKIIGDHDAFDHDRTLTAACVGIGTPEYMAPEQFSEAPNVDGRADQYALAVIVFEMLVATRPFTGPTADILVAKWNTVAPSLAERRPGLPESLVDAVAKSLRASPDDRFSNCRDFASAVLRDVPPWKDDLHLARLICPNCGNLLKLSFAAAGRTGTCPRCKTEMVVADDLGALWLPDEARRQRDSVFAFDLPDGSQKPTRRAPWPLLKNIPQWAKRTTLPGMVGGGLLGVIAGVLLMAFFPPPDSAPSLPNRTVDLRGLEEQVACLTTELAQLRNELDTSRAEQTEAENHFAESMEVLNRQPLVNSVGMRLKLIPAGKFLMGANDGDDDERPVHEQRVLEPFYLGVTEVTNAQWKAVMEVEPPSREKGADQPVGRVSWTDAIRFCRKLSERREEREAGRVYRLPTEVEWEYACRAGTATKWACGDDETAVAVFAWCDDRDGQAQPVASKQPNAWGLYDMHGNVWEWCSDQFQDYPASTRSDLSAATETLSRVCRGGGWTSPAKSCRSAERAHDDLEDKVTTRGFRLVAEIATEIPPIAVGN